MYSLYFGLFVQIFNWTSTFLILILMALFRFENIESCWYILEDYSIQSFVKLFCNETLSKIYRLIIFSSDLKQDNIYLNELKKAIEKEAIKRNFDCFHVLKQNSDSVMDVIYHEKQIIHI